MSDKDTKRKKYIDSDVYTEAKKRIKHVIESFDNVLVAFSGGKDSLTCLYLVQEVYKEMGIKEKVKVFFRDEELIPDDVIDFVQQKAESGEFDFRYYAIPLWSTKYILGKTYDYIQWDKNRKWLRNPPDYAIRLDKDDDRVFSQYDADAFICKNEKGRCAIITGVRADESLMRLASIVQVKNECYIAGTETKRIKLVKPIYDWTQRDIFVYFCKNDIKYCKIYDNEMWNRQPLRVATPLHAESAKRFYQQKTLYPKFYQQLVDIFPEMLVQEKYYTQYSPDAVINDYEHSFDGIRKYIKDKIDDPAQKSLALERVNATETTRKNKLRNGEGIENFGGYPVLYVFRAVVAGQYKRRIAACANPSDDMILYENFQNESGGETEKWQ